MLVHQHHSMSGNWPHDRLGPQGWSSFGNDQGFQSQQSRTEADANDSARPSQHDQKSESSTTSEDSAKDALIQSTAAGDGQKLIPPINVSAETPIPSSERSENGDQEDDGQPIDAEGSAIDDDEDISEGPGEGELGSTEKSPTERWADKRKMKRFRLTHQQTRYLMSEFTRQAHPDAAQRERLSKEIPGLSPRQVQVWFQNRRAKLKRLNTDDRERMMRSRALPENFDMTKALHSSLNGGPLQTLPRLHSTPASSLNYNATMGPVIDTMPSPLSGHAGYAYSPSSGTVSGNQSPSSPDRLSTMSSFRSSFGYRPPHYAQSSGSLPNSLYQPPPRSVGMPERLGGSSGRSSPTHGSLPYMGGYGQDAGGLHPPWDQSSYATPSRTTTQPHSLAPHPPTPGLHDPLLDHSRPGSMRMRSRTSPSSHPSGFQTTPPTVFAGPYSAPLGSPGPTSIASRPLQQSNPGAHYAQPYNPRSPNTYASAPDDRSGSTVAQHPSPGHQQGFAGYYPPAPLHKQEPQRFYEPASGSSTPTIRTPTQGPGLGLYRGEEGSDRPSGADAT